MIIGSLLDKTVLGVMRELPCPLDRAWQPEIWPILS